MKMLDKLKRKVIVLLLLMIVGVGVAQTHEFAPIGAEWHYERLYREGMDLTGITYDRFRSLRTVEINGWKCSEIELFQNLDCDGVANPHTELRYINQEGDQIYEVENGQRYLMYDFSKEPGEYWLVPKYDDTIFVDEVDFVELTDGSYRKRLQTHPVNNPELHIYSIIEGIGMDKSLFPFFILYGPPPCMNGLIRCYSEDGIPLIMSETECDYEIMSVDEFDETRLLIMNTIVDDALHIDFSEIEKEMKYVRIVDMSGRTVFSQETMDKDLEINFSAEPTGVYLVQILIDSRVINNKILKR